MRSDHRPPAPAAAGRWRDWLLPAGIALLGMAVVVAGYGQFSATLDEPCHIAAGQELLGWGSYRAEPMHPPLARLAAAIGPWLNGDRLPAPFARDWESAAPLCEAGIQILIRAEDYTRSLTLARLPLLVFYLMAVAATFWLAARYHGRAVGAAAAALFAAMPAVLGHAGVAATDMAVTGASIAAWAGWRFWLDRPGAGRAALFGTLAAAALACKFTALLWLPVGMAVILALDLADRRRAGGPPRRWPSLWAAVPAGLLLLWAAWGFEIGPVAPRLGGLPLPLPFPELFNGLVQAYEVKLRGGHAIYVLGERMENVGRWYFFPLALLVKTPPALLLLAAVGAGMAAGRAWRRRRAAPLFGLALALAVLAAVMPGNVNLGIRHVLVVYAGLAVLAALPLAWLWRWRGIAGRLAAAAALLLVLVEPARTHPRHLAYFSPLIGLTGHAPDDLLVDSDLDWGQDNRLLADAIRARDIRAVNLLIRGRKALWPMLPDRRPWRLNVRRLAGLRQDWLPQGWFAVSATFLRAFPGDRFAPLRRFAPVARLGDSIFLYDLPAEASLRPEPALWQGPPAGAPQMLASGGLVPDPGEAGRWSLGPAATLMVTHPGPAPRRAVLEAAIRPAGGAPATLGVNGDTSAVGIAGAALRWRVLLQPGRNRLDLGATGAVAKGVIDDAAVLLVDRLRLIPEP